MIQAPLLEAISVCKSFGGFVALDAIDLTIQPGERIGLIGPNGSGKSTFVNCLSGAISTDSGTITFDGLRIEKLPAFKRVRLGIVRSFQIPKPFASLTVLENLHIPLHFATGHRSGTKAVRSEINAQAMHILEEVGLANKARESSASLTQVDMRKLELARAVAAHPKLLIADESMAGLSHSEIDEILALLLKLNEEGIAIIMIEHIMRAVMAFSQRTIVLVAARKIADALPTEVIRNAEVIRAYLGE
jgi:branched-chain amino acid transport system ATP-binding protein